MSSTFKYFAYGSNLLEKRIRINNPTAKRIGIALLKNYRLDFNYWSNRWGGNAATIVPDDSSFVWGAVWEIDNSNSTDLDRQEGTFNGVYKAIEVHVENREGMLFKCRSYQLCNLPQYSPSLPVTRYPSKVYLNTILEGAIESKLPEEWVQFLKSIPHNGFEGPVNYQSDD
ncbi:gamma-glutamylcyclotransferase isoform X2 [Halyomorpha halys]|nr:gamma-glutamylcyclotransferase-like [Halyomorpha halys]